MRDRQLLRSGSRLLVLIAFGLMLGFVVRLLWPRSFGASNTLFSAARRI